MMSATNQLMKRIQADFIRPRRIASSGWFFVSLMVFVLCLILFVAQIETTDAIDAIGSKIQPKVISVVHNSPIDATPDKDVVSSQDVRCKNIDVICPPDSDRDVIAAIAALKGSPMAPYASLIVGAARKAEVNYTLIIGIAYAESSLGRAFYQDYDKDNCSNFWGIKASTPTGQRADGSWLRCYLAPEYGINSMAQLLARGYKNMTPEQMVCKYVGKSCSPSWVKNVNKYYKK